MKPILLILICFIVFDAALVADSPSNEKLKQLRHQLDVASMPPPQGGYSAGVDAYIALMKLDPAGFEVLTEAWAYDPIPEENWLNWKWEFLERFADSKGGNDATVDAYGNYLDRKMAKDDKFATASADRLAKIKIYTDEAIVSIWLPGGLGSRRVGYTALKQRHPDLPAFDYQASDGKRTKQLQEIDAFLKAKK